MLIALFGLLILSVLYWFMLAGFLGDRGILNAEKLNNDGRYAELRKLLLDIRRYRSGAKFLQLLTKVDLADGNPPVQVSEGS